MCEQVCIRNKINEVRDFKFIDTNFFDIKISVITYYQDNIAIARMKIDRCGRGKEYGVEIANKTTKDALKKLMIKANFFCEGKDLDQYVDKLISQMKLIFPNETTTRKMKGFGYVRHDTIKINNKSYSYIGFDTEGESICESFVWGDDGKIMEGKDRGYNESVAQALVNGNVIDKSKKQDAIENISALGKWFMSGYYD